MGTAGSNYAAAAAVVLPLPPPNGQGVHRRLFHLFRRCCRHRAALASRRWHAAAHAPGSLRVVRLSSFDNSVARLQSLAAWLQRHGQHVQEVRLDVNPPNQAAQPCTWELAGCLTACAAAAAGSLQQLSLQMYARGSTLCVTSWCAALRQLRSLDLVAGYAGQLHIASSLAGLTVLTQLSLSGQAVSVDAAAQLPPAVERFKLRDAASTALPSQVGWHLLLG